MNLPALHEKALATTGEIVARIDSEQMNWPTPNDDWDVRDTLNHLVSGNFWVGELMNGKTIDEVGDRLDGDVLGDDVGVAWERSAMVANEAFNAGGAMAVMAAVSYGPVPGEVYCGHRLMDVVLHGWDLAKATGQDTTLDAELVEGTLAILEPQLDMVRASGAFATDVEVPEGADPQTKLLGWTGRRA